MRTYQVYQVDAFTTEKLQGNPAGVVVNADGLSTSEMQAIARELNNSETAFLFSPASDDHEVWIRYFTPTTEVPICGHATIASHFVRANQLELDECTVLQKSGVGVLPVRIKKDSLGYEITMVQGPPEFSEEFSKDLTTSICSALGLSKSELDIRCPIQIVSTGHSKVMIGIQSIETLHKLQPNLPKLSEISSEIDCNGFFVFTLDSNDENIFVHGRMFAPAIGIPEDPVTGNANGPLGAYIAQHGILAPDAAGCVAFVSQQGEAIGRAGRVKVTVLTDQGIPREVSVTGRAVVVFCCELEL